MRGQSAENPKSFGESLADLFAEAKEKNADSARDFRDIKKSLLRYFAACEKTTAARARASTPILLPGGLQPTTHVGYPPGYLKIDDAARNRLHETNSPKKFLATLSEIIKEQAPPKRRKQRVTKGYCQQKKATKLSSTSPEVDTRDLPSGTVTGEASKASQSTANLTSAGSLQRDGDRESEQRLLGTSPSTHNSPMPAAAPIEANNNTKSTKSTSQSPCHMKGKIHKTSAQGRDPSPEPFPFISPPASTQSNRQVDRSEMMMSDETKDGRTPTRIRQKHQSPGSGKGRVRLVMNDRTRSDWSPDSETESDNDENGGTLDEDTEMTDPADGEYPNMSSQLATLAQEIKNTRPETWSEYQPKLLQHLDSIGLGVAQPSAAFDPDNYDTPLKRFQRLVPQLSAEIANIPPEAWHSYERKVITFCKSKEIRGMDLERRLAKLNRIIYLHEEEEGIIMMDSGDWDRVKSSVRLVAFLAEALGPCDAGDHQKTDQWVTAKLQDLRWLKKCFARHDQIRAIAAPTIPVTKS